MPSHPIDKGSGQPEEIKQPTPQQPTLEGAKGTSSFQHLISQPSEQMNIAMKKFLKSDELSSSWKEGNTTYNVTTAKDPEDKGSQLVTIKAEQEGHTTSAAQYRVVSKMIGYHEQFTVYTMPGNRPAPTLDTQVLKKIPNNLGKLISEDPKLGRQLYHSLIKGMAMKMMRDMRKKQSKLFSQPD